MVCGYAGHAAAVYGAGNTSYGLYEFCKGLVLPCRSRSDDAVTVEKRAGEDLGEIGRIFYRNGLLLLSKVFQDLAGR